MDRELEGLRLELERRKFPVRYIRRSQSLIWPSGELKLALERLEKGQSGI